MIWRCAWCAKEDPEPIDARLDLTHGICERHLEEFKRHLAARRELQKAPGRTEGAS